MISATRSGEFIARPEIPLSADDRLLRGDLEGFTRPTPAAVIDRRARRRIERRFQPSGDRRDRARHHPAQSENKGGMLEVRLTGLSSRAQGVKYALEVTGTSTSRHRGSTQLASGTRVVLSTMRTWAGADCCVKLVAEEEGRAPCEITRGTCAAG